MAHEGQHQSPLELITQNVRSILADVLNKLECGDVDHTCSIDYSLNLSPLYIITVSRNVVSSLMGRTIFKYTALPWEPK